MALRKIATIGHPVLRQKARTLTREELAGPEMQRLVDDLVDTMRDASGAGIAANQVHEPVRICVIEIQNNPRYPYKPNWPLTVLVNGLPLPTSPGRRTVFFEPDGPGFVRLTVMDAAGSTDSVVVRLQ